MTFDPFAPGAPEELDFAIIAGVPTPGVAFIDGAGTPRGWDEQQGYATDGKSLKWVGDGLSEFTLRIQCWTSDHFKEWESLREIVKKTPPNVKPKVLDIRAPQLEELDIHAVVVMDVSQWVQIDDTGMWEKTIKLKVYRAPRPAIASPKASIDKPDSEDDAKDAVDLKLEQLEAEKNAKAKAYAAQP